MARPGRPIRRSGDRFVIDLAEPARALVRSLAAQMRVLVTSDTTAVRRLFPPPYGDDAERNAGYAALAGTELIDSRLAALAMVEESVDAREVSEEELLAWMRSLNDIRLVLGTILDVDEDDPLVAPPDAPETAAAYEFLGFLLEMVVEALAE
jgi:Domain of unknown function (DUF2017)